MLHNKFFRWKECVQEVSDNMHISLAALYVREYFDKEAKKNVQEMVSYVQNQLKNTIEKVRYIATLKCDYKLSFKTNRVNIKYEWFR